MHGGASASAVAVCFFFLTTLFLSLPSPVSSQTTPSENAYLCLNPLQYNATHIIPATGFPCESSLNAYVKNTTKLLINFSLRTFDCSVESAQASYIRALGEYHGCCNNRQSKCWIDHSAVCKNPSTYQRLHKMPGNNETCDTSMNGYRQDLLDSKQAPFNYATLNCKGDLAIAQLLRFFGETEGCCSDHKSICWVDNSFVCQDRSKYRATATFSNNAGFTCDAVLTSLYRNTESSLYRQDLDTFVCSSNLTQAATVREIGSQGCCVDAKSKCFVDYSAICLNRSLYTGDKILPQNNKFTCNRVLDLLFSDPTSDFYRVDLANTDCKTVSSAVRAAVRSLGSLDSCCSDGKSRCYENHSAICLHPAKWAPKNVVAVNGFTCNANLDTLTDDPTSDLYHMNFTTFDCKSSFSKAAAVVAFGKRGCCTDGESICSKSYNFASLCANPVRYNGSFVLPGSNKETCDHVLSSLFYSPGSELYQTDLSSLKCKLNVTKDALIRNLGSSGCCSDRRSKCYIDYSGVCLHPLQYVGNKLLASGFTCDQTLNSLYDDAKSPMFQQPLASMNCLLNTTKQERTSLLIEDVGHAKKCCVDGKSRCFLNHSALCQVPSQYRGNNIVKGSTFSCDDVLTANRFVSSSSLYRTNLTLFNCAANATKAADIRYYGGSRGGCCANNKSKCSLDFSHICRNATKYVGSRIVAANGLTCDDNIESMIATVGNPIYLQDIKTITCDQKVNPATAALVRNVGSEWGCCSDLKSKCWEDHSALCVKPSAYRPFNLVTGTNKTCDNIIGNPSPSSIFYGLDMAKFDCASNATISYVFREYATIRGCCADGLSKCDVDYSGICRQPSSYLGAKIVKKYDISCNYLLDSFTIEPSNPLFGLSFSSNKNLTCPADLSRAETIRHVGTELGCCADGQSLCFTDYSRICMNAQAFNGQRQISIGNSTCNDLMDSVVNDPESEFFGFDFPSLSCAANPVAAQTMQYVASDMQCCKDRTSRCFPGCNACGTTEFNVFANDRTTTTFTIDGKSNPTLNLYRGCSYKFNVNATGHPFFIQLGPGAAKTGKYLFDGPVANQGVEHGYLSFSLNTTNSPSSLYYQCGNFASMNGLLVVRDCPCVAGTVISTSGTATCRTCDAGSVSSVVAGKTCFQCAKGTMAPYTGMTACVSCAAGESSGEGAAACQPCPPMTFSSARAATACTQCPVGKYARQSGSTICTACEAGKATSEAGECASCKAGRFSPTPGSVDCLPCSAGTFANKYGASTCSVCPQGLLTGADSCLSTLPSASPLIASCPLGTASPSSSHLCTPCIGGTFSNGTDLTACFVCEAGKSTSVPGFSGSTAVTATAATRCFDCPIGSYAKASSATCLACPAGWFGSAVGLSQCTACSQGRYQNRTGQSRNTCQACPPGLFSGPGAMQCTISALFTTAADWVTVPWSPVVASIGKAAARAAEIQVAIKTAGYTSQPQNQILQVELSYISAVKDYKVVNRSTSFTSLNVRAHVRRINGDGTESKGALLTGESMALRLCHRNWTALTQLHLYLEQTFSNGGGVGVSGSGSEGGTTSSSSTSSSSPILYSDTLDVCKRLSTVIARTTERSTTEGICFIFPICHTSIYQAGVVIGDDDATATDDSSTNSLLSKVKAMFGVYKYLWAVAVVLVFLCLVACVVAVYKRDKARRTKEYQAVTTTVNDFNDDMEMDSNLRDQVNLALAEQDAKDNLQREDKRRESDGMGNNTSTTTTVTSTKIR